MWYKSWVQGKEHEVAPRYQYVIELGTCKFHHTVGENENPQ